ncbi:PREDICTED: immunoglobulin superfamily member 10 [Sturnus vulgaris]|uniref:immunoglobulin superfamily member 10 n=1 Tax=Sturnus vulgaris TaxID=9172 RepID=UPI00071A422D|nr:PREDICTED: immunoglobulin superfamily member 10 [Sturnus vulgaris]
MLHSNEISTIPGKVFSDLHSLQVLKMSYNKVRVLQQDVFYGLSSLVRLHMDHNHIEFVNPNVFYGLTSLRLVHLDGNLIQQLHPDTFVTLRYNQIFRISFLKHISLSDNVLTSLPREMFSYMSELESIYLHGNPWSCDCSLQGFAEWAQDRPDVIKCRKERSSGVQQCPVCAGPKNHNGKSLGDLPSASFTCTKPVIHDSLKSRNLTVPDDGDFSSVSPKDLIAPIGSVVLNLTDQAGNRGDLVCDVQKPKETSPISFDKNGHSTVLKTSFSASLVCAIDYGHIQQLWSILALYSNSPLELEQTVQATHVPFISYEYKQVYSEKDEVFTDIRAVLRAEPAWLMQRRVALQLDRVATTLSTLHVQLSSRAQLSLPSHGKGQGGQSWAIIPRDNSTQTEHAVLVGGTVELGCQAAGEPAPALEWLLADGSRVRAPHISEDGRIVVLSSGVLTLRTADVFDTGLYHCISTNQRDADVLTFRITVLEPLVEHGGVNGARLSPALGSTLHLPCASAAAPDAAVSWVLPEHTVLRRSAGNKRVFANGTLEIQGVTERDAGYFRCVAANRYGVDLLVFQVLVRQDETALKKQHGALGEWEEGSATPAAPAGSAAAQRHPSATPAAPGGSAAAAASSQGTGSARRRNSHGKMPHWPHGDRAGRRFRGHRRQFVSSGRRVDPQRWAALLEKTKRNLTGTDKRGEVAAELPIQVHKLSEVPEDEEETSGDLISPEEEFIPATERSPVSAPGRATEPMITAGPEETVSATPAWNSSLLLTEPSAPLPSPPPHPAAPARKRPQTFPKPTDSWERSDLSQISANGIKQSTVPSGTSTLFPAGQNSIYSGESNNQHLRSASTTPMTEAAGTSKAVTPQNTADKLHIFTESIDNVPTITDHQVPVETVNAPSSEIGPIYFHSTQKGGTPYPPLAPTLAAHQQIQLIQDVPTQPPQLQQHHGRRRKISGRRRIVRPGRTPGVKEHRYHFGRPGSARGGTAVAAGVQLNVNSVSNVPTSNNLSISVNPFSPEAPQSSPSTVDMALEHPVGTHQNTAFLREEEKKQSAMQKSATTVTSVPAKDTATTAASALGAMGLKPTVPLVAAPQTDTRVTKTEILRVGRRRGQRRKRPPKKAAPQPPTTATPRASSPPRGGGQRQPQPRPPPQGTERGNTLHSPQITAPRGRDKDGSERRQDQGTTAIPKPLTSASASRNHFSKPRIVGGKSAAYTLLANSDAFIPCEATGNPPPTIQWTKIPSGVPRWAVLANGTLSIARAGPQDAGQYLCTAANALGTARLLVTLAVLASPPRIARGHQRLLTAHSGTSVALACRAQGWPPPGISWLLANSTHLSHSSSSSASDRARVEPDGTLVIRAVTVYDRGLYTCLASSPAGSDTLAVRLQVVAAPPSILEEKRQSVAAAVGQSLRLPCTARGNPEPTVHWVLPDGTALRPGEGAQPLPPRLWVLPDGTLHLGTTAPSDSGTYECIATSSTGSDRRVVSLELQRTETLPKIASASQHLTRLSFGDRLLLNCTASGEPKPRIIWRLPSKAVVDQWHRMGSRIHVYPNGSLAIEAVTEKDAGDYLCVARNRIGDDLILMKVGITMKPAKIDHKQQFKKLVPYGKDFRVDCKASGSPTPEISWGLPDGTVVNNAMLADDSGHRARRFVLFDNGTLYLNKAGVAEGGDYTCYAQNTLGRDEMKIHVTVVVAAPQIKQNYKTHVTVTAGDTALLDCEAAGEPRAQIFWLLPSSEMISSSTDRHSLHANGSLSISQAGLLDAGQYLCVARNPGGDDTKLYKLDVAAKPPIINGVYRNKTIMKVTAVRHSKKHIDCRAEGTPPPQIMWIMPDNIFLTAPYYGSRIVVHKNGTLEIRNIRPSDTADFICVARNDGGETVLVVQLEVTEMLRRPMFRNPFNEKIIAKPGRAITLNCSVDGNPPPDISWMLPNGTWFSIGTSQFVTGSSGTLTIPNPEGRHAGRYRCAARNQVGYIEKMMVLEVAQKPNILTRPAGLVKGVSGEPLSLHCLAEGSPKPRVEWALPGGQVLEGPRASGRFLLLENGTLLIRAASAQDSGKYLCRASNAAGDSSLSIPVVVTAYAPRIVGRPPPAIHTLPGAAVQLHCVALGIPKPEITWHLPDGSTLSTAQQGRGSGGELLHPTGTLLLQSPRGSSSGLYRCTARNALGTDTALAHLHVL